MRKNNTNLVVKLAVACILIVLIFSVINIQMDLNDIKQEKEKLAVQIEKVSDTIDEINIRLDTPLTEEYIERIAREQLGYRKNGEIIFYNDLAN